MSFQTHEVGGFAGDPNPEVFEAFAAMAPPSPR